MRNYDVIVCGGGSAGICAAVQSARAGAKTLLVEKSSGLGGTTTNGAINFPGLFHAWGEQVIRGIGWELVERCVQESGSEWPDFSNTSLRHWQHQILVDRAIYTALCDEIVQESSADILFHAMPAIVEEDGNKKELTLCTKTGLQKYSTQVIIDCTGDANVAALAGCVLTEEKIKQPATLSCTASGYTIEDLDIPEINEAFTQYVKEGKAKFTDASWSGTEAHVEAWLHKKGANANHISGFDAFTSEDKTALEIEGRQSVLRLYRFLKQQKGLENIRIDFMGTECGVRDTRRILGKTTITVQDYTSGRKWEDGLCYSFYPIDLHTSGDDGLDFRQLEEGVVPSIPASALMPKDSENILVAGRCLSADNLAHSAARVQASCMAMGQGAGALAALASQQHCGIDEVAIRDVHQLLHDHGAIVPELAKVSESAGSRN